MSDTERKKQIPPDTNKYKPEYAEQAHSLALLGITSKAELAKVFRVHVTTIYNWMKTHPDFEDAIISGGTLADAKVAKQAYANAIGYEATKEVIRKTPNGENEVIEITVPILPDQKAAEYWLNKRQRQLWGGAQDQLPEQDESGKAQSVLGRIAKLVGERKTKPKDEASTDEGK